MGSCNAACAITGIPLDVESLGFFVVREQRGRWEAFSLCFHVKLDAYQSFPPSRQAPGR